MAAVLLVFMGAGWYSSCGLPTTDYLAPPENEGAESPGTDGTILFFSHSTKNDSPSTGSVFLGYDIWYKLYNDSTGTIIADEDFIERTPRPPGTARLSQRGFRRAVALRPGETYDDDRAHITKNDVGGNSRFYLDLRDPRFRDDPEGSLERETEIELRRGDSAGPLVARLRRRHVARPEDLGGDIDDHEGGSAGFWNAPRYVASDHDVGQAVAQTGQAGGTLYLVIYVIARGRDANFQPFFSEPLRMVDYGEINPKD
ncbi:hypothetical protein AU468_01690 [Alkalispirochaeta sphaeroplastigenens]|uniref:Uncharacterized protein n=1 Tax=Alkalispirochaeta sphaeroplastigenens TaxID=1187066 RepID=A0A2S4K0E7_9SPIO|nr:hypothetical protein [Alkalispirochaeta sphaeroplastigenens]POR05226.1 hypothetical protein AU468_01690 [Alkalispirochaeta sphaeroplastigenens]